MKWNVAAECISAVMLLIIWTYSRKGNPVPSLKNRIFQLCFLTTFCSMTCNILSTLVLEYPGHIPTWAAWAVNMVYFAATPLMGMVYYYYTAATLYERQSGVGRMFAWGSLAAGIYLLLVAATPFTGCLFYIDKGGHYTRGPWIFATYLVFYIYCLASVGLAVWRRRWVEKPVGRILTSFPVIAVLTIFVQQRYPHIILTGSAATSALLLIYLFLQNKQIDVDHLTSLPNRTALLKMLEFQLHKKRQPFAVVVLSLREFKQINGAFGQEKGDALLQAIALFLRQVAPVEDLYRYGGDEFALLVPGDGAAAVDRVVERLEQRMAHPWQVGELSFATRMVVGVVHYPRSADSVGGLVDGIEYAVKQAKAQGVRVCDCGPELLQGIRRRTQVAEILKDVTQTGAFELHYQPILDVKTNTFVLAESLMRIPQSPLGPIYPSEFIPVAEETGIIVELTYGVLQKACAFVDKLQKRGIALRGVHVNFSGVQFRQDDVAERVIGIIRRSGIPSSMIKVEITESALVENHADIQQFAARLHQEGILLGLDDFGTGYSNIVSVMETPLDVIKLDKSLLWSAMASERSALLLAKMVEIFHQLGQKVLVEGVEDAAQDQFVRSCGIDLIQGYYYARPLAENDVLDLLQKAQAAGVATAALGQQ